MELGVNIDHVATLRQARGTIYPSPLDAAKISEESGADLITIHLREDRRHIVDADVKVLREEIKTRMKLEIACWPLSSTLVFLSPPTSIFFVNFSRTSRGPLIQSPDNSAK